MTKTIDEEIQKYIKMGWKYFSYDYLLNIIDSSIRLIAVNNYNDAKKIFSDQELMKSLIASRGPSDKFLIFFRDNFVNYLEYNKLSITSKDFKKILDLIRKDNLSDYVLVYFLEALFHLNEEKLFKKIIKIILNNKNKLNNSEVYTRVIHTLASWKMSRENDFVEGAKLNLEVINWAKEKDENLYLKAKFGLLYSKNLLPKEKVDDFLKLFDELLNCGNIYDGFRARIEAIMSLVDLSRQQKLEEIAFININKAKDLALDVYVLSKKIHYPNLEIIASEVLSQVYMERGVKNMLRNNLESLGKIDMKKSKSYEDKAEKLREMFGYKTRFKPRYKSTVLSHVR